MGEQENHFIMARTLSFSLLYDIILELVNLTFFNAFSTQFSNLPSPVYLGDLFIAVHRELH